MFLPDSNTRVSLARPVSQKGQQQQQQAAQHDWHHACDDCFKHAEQQHDK
jgi:hypothetical protein